MRAQEIRFHYHALAAASIAVLAAVLVVPAIHGQTFSVIHSFTGENDGGNPRAGLMTDSQGNLYGTAFSGGAYGQGLVYKLRDSSGWILTPVHSFLPYDVGASPDWITFAPDGTIFGATYHSYVHDTGTVFHLRPSANTCRSVLCEWLNSTLYQFQDVPDGANPEGSLVLDQRGNLYGSTYYGGHSGQACGTIYELSPSSGGGWTEAVLYRFSCGSDGSVPNGVILGPDGSLYGTTIYGGINNGGVVFRFTPSGSGGTMQTIYTFQNNPDGFNPAGGLIFDGAGNIYGTTAAGGMNSGGTVFELVPSNGVWTKTILFNFAGLDECGPYNSLSFDSSGNIYGTTYCDDPYTAGTVFKLSYANGSWTNTVLHNFTNGADGGFPYSNVVIDANGNACGTTLYGGLSNPSICGPSGCGVIWEITP
jgi:uncharacterized repeat protein (TIGR03803 family)